VDPDGLVIPPAPVSLQEWREAEWREISGENTLVGDGSPCVSLTTLTQNVWFDKLHKQRRLEALIDIIFARSPAVDVVSLQEMTKDATTWLLADERVRGRFLTTDPAAVTRMDSTASSRLFHGSLREVETCELRGTRSCHTRGLEGGC
jgi:hypothetical protein